MSIKRITPDFEVQDLSTPKEALDTRKTFRVDNDVVYEATKHVIANRLLYDSFSTYVRSAIIKLNRYHRDMNRTEAKKNNE